MRPIRLLSIALILLPTVAQAQVYSTFYGAPTSGITRASFVEMVMNRLGTPQDGTNCFSDVRTQSFAPTICAAKQMGIVTGDSSAKFRPNDAISFVEAVAVAVRAKGGATASYDNPWYRPYLTTLELWNAFPSSVTNIFYPISSSQAQELIDNVFFADHSSTSSRSSSSRSSNTDDNRNDDVQLTVASSDSSADIGDRVTYTIKIKNTGNRDMNNIDVHAYIDANFDYISSTDGGDYNRDRIDWDNIDVNEGETETITLKLRVSGSADDGEKLSLRVTAEDSEVRKTLTVDDNGGSNNNNGDLHISITDSESIVERGDTVTYRIVLRNDDNSDIRTDVRAILDNDMDYVSSSNGGDENDGEVMWDNVLIRRDSSVTLTVKVRISDSANDGGTVRLDVSADGEEDSETTSVDRNGSSNNDYNDHIDISVSDSPDPAQVGDIVTYTIRLENNDNQNSIIDAIAHLDNGMSFYSASSGGYRDGSTVRWDNVDIYDGDVTTLTLRVRINDNADAGDTLRLEVKGGDADEQETTRVEN